jgi:hypothetical protein
MKHQLIPQECLSIKLQENIARWTPVNDLRVLLYLAAQTPGNILEIGCNEGITTKELAVAFPARKVYGVDYIGPVVTMCPDQRWERPAHIGVHCLDIPNAIIFNQLSSNLDYSTCPGVNFIFIDGDHTYEGVKSDTEKAIAFLKSVGGGTIVWHDYKEDAACYGVKKYLDEEISKQFDVTVYDGTWIATAKIIGSTVPKRILINHDHVGFGDWIMWIACLKMLQRAIPDLVIDLWVTDACNSSLMAMPGQCGLRCQFVSNPSLETYAWYWPRPSQWPHLHSDHIMADKLRELNAALGTNVPLDMTCLARPVALEPVPVPDGDFVVMPSEGSHGINSQEKNWKGFSELAEKLKGVAYAIVQIGAISTIAAFLIPNSATSSPRQSSRWGWKTGSVTWQATWGCSRTSFSKARWIAMRNPRTSTIQARWCWITPSGSPRLIRYSVKYLVTKSPH